MFVTAGREMVEQKKRNERKEKKVVYFISILNK